MGDVVKVCWINDPHQVLPAGDLSCFFSFLMRPHTCTSYIDFQLLVFSADWSHSSRCFLCNVGLIVLQVSALLYALCDTHTQIPHTQFTHSPHTQSTHSPHTQSTHSPHTHTHSTYRLKVILAMVRRVHLVYLRRIWESSVTKLRHVKYEGVFSFTRINAIAHNYVWLLLMNWL